MSRPAPIACSTRRARRGWSSTSGTAHDRAAHGGLHRSRHRLSRSARRALPLAARGGDRGRAGSARGAAVAVRLRVRRGRRGVSRAARPAQGDRVGGDAVGNGPGSGGVRRTRARIRRDGVARNRARAKAQRARA